MLTTAFTTPAVPIASSAGAHLCGSAGPALVATQQGRPTDVGVCVEATPFAPSDEAHDRIMSHNFATYT